MKNFLLNKKIFLLGLVFVLFVFIVAPSISSAQAVATPTPNIIAPVARTSSTNPVEPGPCDLGSGVFDTDECVTDLAASLGNILLSASAAWLAVTASILNGSMIITLHMKETMDHVPQIEATWKVIRDFSNIFVIFILLYAAIRMILGMKGLSFNELIKNIILAALLINFSLFFTRIAIDASNLISLSFYNAIIPGKPIVFDKYGNIPFTQIFNDGGISNLFMQGLNIQKIYKPNDFADGNTQNMKTIVVALGGSMIMFIAGVSFLVATFAFILRIALFILLLAFSPLPFIGMIIPGVDKYSKRWTDTLKSQCIFMPVYLMLMYVAIKIISADSFGKFLGNPKESNFWDSGGVIGPGMIGVIMQYVVAIILINVPLLAALELGGEGVKIANQWTSKGLDKAKGWTKGAAVAGGRWAGQNTAGRLASKLATNEAFQDFASRNKFGELALKGVRGTAGGYDKKLSDQVAARTKFAESLGMNQGNVNVLDKKRRDAEAAAKRAKEYLESAKKSGAASSRITYLESNLRIAEKDARSAGEAVLTEKTKRQTAYAGNTNSGALDTGFMYVSRKNKVAAAQVSIKVKEQEKAVREKHKTKSEENLKKAKESLQREKDKVERLSGIDTATITTEQRKQLAEHTKEMDRLEKEIKGSGSGKDGLKHEAEQSAEHFEDIVQEIEDLKTIK